MRSDVIAALGLALAACTWQITDPDRAVGVVADGLSDDDAASLEEAARCWNLEFGTHLLTGSAAATADQQVNAYYDDQTCLHAIAQVQGGWPESLAVCPQRYWGQVANPYGSAIPITPFRVISHELGHVLNIVGHPDDPYAVMRGGGLPLAVMFTAADRDAFRGSNPGFSHDACPHVVRSFRPGSNLQVDHCACDTNLFDPSRPIAIVPSEAFTGTAIAILGVAVDCWNLRYQTALAIRPAESQDQIAFLESLVERCLPAGFAYHQYRVQDGDTALVCTMNGYGSPYYPTPMEDAAHILGVTYKDARTAVPFTATDDQEFAKRYPDRAIGCHAIVRDVTTGVCSCND